MQVHIELWQDPEARGKELALNFCRKGHDQTLRGTAGAIDAQTFTHLDCEDIKSQGFLFSASLLRGTQFELLSCYSTTASRLSYFMDPDSGNPGLSQ